MGSFSIIVPEATTNLVTNPSVELNTTGYAGVNASIARVSAVQSQGSWSIEVTPSNNAFGGVMYYPGTFLLTAGQTYAVSFDILGVSGVGYRAYVADQGAVMLSPPKQLLGTGRWQRVSFLYTETTTAYRRIYITKDNNTSLSPFYIDALQAEQKPYATTYCDGDESGCTWNGLRHASTARRSAQSRRGGRLVDLETVEAFLVSQAGTGMPAMRNIATPRASGHGARFQRSLASERSFTIVFSVSGDDTSDWHAQRQALIDYIKPDATAQQQPFTLVYTAGLREVAIDAVYDAGLDMNDGKKEIEDIAIRCIAYDPFWYALRDSSTNMQAMSTVTFGNLVERTPLGAWSNLNEPAPLVGGVFTGPSVTNHAWGNDGFLYIFGNFSSFGGVSANKAARWDGENWSALGSGPPALAQYGVKPAFDSTGALYIVLQNNTVAKFSGSSWSTIGGTIDFANTRGITIGPDGSLYACGSFASIGGVSTPCVARWNGTTWVAMGGAAFKANSSSEGIVNLLHFGINGTLYAFGSFYLGNIPSLCINVAQWDGATWQRVGYGLLCGAGGIVCAANGLDGLLYVAGPIASIYNGKGGSNGAAQGVARWNGTDWQPLGKGTELGSATPRAIAVDQQDGSLYIFGDYYSPTPPYIVDTLVFPCSIAQWNGSSFLPLDIALGTGQFVTDGTVGPRGEITVVFPAGSYPQNCAATTVVQNNGSTVAYPLLAISGPGRLYAITNRSTNSKLLFNLVLSAGETVTIDTRPNQRSVTSSFRGNILGSLIPGSDLAGFSLIPGQNALTCFVDNAAATAVVRWQDQYWSIDSAGKP